MNRHVIAGLILFGTVLSAAIIVSAAVPQQLTYQGYLQDSTGVPVADGQYPIQFTIYDVPVDGKELWNSGFQKINVAGGLFTVQLGSTHMPEIPSDLFADTSAYLGVTIEGSSEMMPRSRLASVPYSYHALRADSAGYAAGAGGVDWTAIDDMPAGFADGVDDVGGGDITGVIAGTNLSGGGTSGDVTLSLASAISGSHTFSGTNTFTAGTYFNGAYSTRTISDNDNFAYGVLGEVTRTNSKGNYAITIGVHGIAAAPLDERYGVYGYAEGDGTRSNGNSVAVRALAWDGDYAIGLYGYPHNAHIGYGVFAGASTENCDIAYAGYFSGNVNVTGTLSKGGGAFKIDHPLDPERKYLQHSFVESPDMLNVYNGNVVTDGNGYASVELPEYFEALNKDFRYQLTVIGEFAQAIIAQEISNNMFVIRTDKPEIKVSWQVTGIRHDNWAENNRIEVEVDKRPEEVGTYLHPKEYGLPIERSVDYENIRLSEEEYNNRQ